MNETRNIIVGLEIGKNQSQICYYDRREKEPISVSVKAGSNQYLFPTRLSKKPGEEVWHYGMEADYFSRQEGEISITGLLGIFGKLFKGLYFSSGNSGTRKTDKGSDDYRTPAFRSSGEKFISGRRKSGIYQKPDLPAGL